MCPSYRQLPSLASGSRGAGSPPFFSTMKPLRRPSSFSSPSGLPRIGYHVATALILDASAAAIGAANTRAIGRPATLRPVGFPVETGGPPGFPWMPVHVCPALRPRPAVRTKPSGCVRVAPAIHKTKAPAKHSFSRLYHTAFMLPVYASCQPLDGLRKTRFRRLVRPYRAGLGTC